MKESDELIGKTFAERYQVEKLIGRGGMGFVYKAQHTTMDKAVALKVLSREVAENPENVERFQREVAASSQLRHPHTIQIFDYGRGDEGRLYLAMEFLSGITMAERLRRDRVLSAAAAVHITRQILKALREAHAGGIIHRDLKPDNVFLCKVFGETDFVKVLDFGIAKFYQGDRIKQTLTRAGFVCGTPQYLAPEQGLGLAVSPATDLYSLGVMFYEMLTGAPPFYSEDPVSMVMKHIHEPCPPLPTPVRTLMPNALALLIRQLLDKNPQRRPQSAGEVLERLDEVDEYTDEVPELPTDPGEQVDGSTPDPGPTLVGHHTPIGQHEMDAARARITGELDDPGHGIVPLSGDNPGFPSNETDGVTMRMKRMPWETGRRKWLLAGLLLAASLVVGALSAGMWFKHKPAQQTPEAETLHPGTSTSDRVEPGPTPAVAPELAAARDVVTGQPEPAAEVAPAQDVRMETAPSLQAEDTAAPDEVKTPREMVQQGDVRGQEVSEPRKEAPLPLQLKSEPSGAEVLLNGLSMGRTPLDLRLKPGMEKVRIEIRKEGFVSQVWEPVPDQIAGMVAGRTFELKPTKKAGRTQPDSGNRKPPRTNPFGEPW